MIHCSNTRSFKKNDSWEHNETHMQIYISKEKHVKSNKITVEM